MVTMVTMEMITVDSSALGGAAEWPVQAARDSAFAAILAGSVVTWGDPDCGGDSSIQEQLRRFQEFFFFLF